MYIKDGEYYHLHNKNAYPDLWKVDNIINFSNKTLNYFNYHYEKYSPKIIVDNIEYLPLEALTVILNNNLHIQDKNYTDYVFKNIYAIVGELGLFIREEIFEEIRKNYFPELPSRKTCIWVFEKNAAKYWGEILSRDYELYKLELTGIMHKADQKHLKNEIYSHEELKREAFNYWTGSDNKNQVEEELLFEGIVKIKEKYKDINEIISS